MKILADKFIRVGLLRVNWVCYQNRLIVDLINELGGGFDSNFFAVFMYSYKACDSALFFKNKSYPQGFERMPPTERIKTQFKPPIAVELMFERMPPTERIKTDEIHTVLQPGAPSGFALQAHNMVFSQKRHALTITH